jgi:hypothetical protein
VIASALRGLRFAFDDGLSNLIGRNFEICEGSTEQRTSRSVERVFRRQGIHACTSAELRVRGAAYGGFLVRKQSCVPKDAREAFLLRGVRDVANDDKCIDDFGHPPCYSNLCCRYGCGWLFDSYCNGVRDGEVDFERIPCE